MVVLKKNGCRICQKVFCCSDCRDKHEESKHPKPKCFLCVKQALPLPFKSDTKGDSAKHSELVSHVTFNHLPLRCKLCGEKFKNSADLLAAQSCRWWSREKKLPLTPQVSQSSDASKSLCISCIETSSISRTKHQENFDSPPDLVRNTSTPVHHPALALPGQKLPLGGAAAVVVPQFHLKTPTSFDQSSATPGTAGSSGFESRYYTGLAELSSANGNKNNNNNNKDLDRNQSEIEQTYYSPAYSILKKRLDVMKPDSLDSMEKRVRFSDQCIVLATPSSADSSACFSENEIFFEARESLEDEGSGRSENSNDNAEDKEDASPDSAAEGGKNEACACCNTRDEKSKLPDCSSSSSAENKTSSSRVLMMLLVEKTDSSKSLSSLDLAPLIDSGLRKLEETAAARPDLEMSEKRGLRKDCPFEKAGKPRAVVETRQESKIEEISVQVQDSVTSGCNSSTNNAYESDGIFSVMARVVRSALMKLPAVGSSSASASSSRNLSREPLPQSGACSSASGVTSTSSLSIATTAEILAVGSVASAAKSSQLLLQRSSSSKRPRDRNDSVEEHSLPASRDTPGTSSPRQEAVSSPAAKRHRGWYRIRAREPIARMRERQLVPQSPTGASRQTQRFQQGSLTIGDTFLPLPSRAHQHQSTQTED